MRYQRKADLLGAPIDDELVLLHVDRGEYFSLKGIGPELWVLLEAPHSMDEMVDWACEHYEVSAETALADITRFVSELRDIDALDELEH